MAFNTAVSGLKAANSDLSVIGNNIANASTTGFKSSRAEFADVYAASGIASGGSTIGAGVQIKDVSQQFGQGNVSFTNNALDLAINGNGFFVVSNNGAREYSRAGIFGVDSEGTIVDATGKALQGFQASETGAIGGSLSELIIDTANIEPRQTTAVTSQLNLDASEVEPAVRGSSATSTGAAIGRVQSTADNGYPSELFTFTAADGSTRSTTTAANASAREIASQLNLITDVSAVPTTQASMVINSDNGGLELTLNDVTLIASTGVGSVTPQEVAIAINNLSNTTLPGIVATFDAATDTVNVTSTSGEDLRFGINSSGDQLDQVTIVGSNGTTSVLRGDGLGDGDNDGSGAPDGTNDDGFVATVGGSVVLTMDEGITVDSATIVGGASVDDGSGLFAQDIGQSPFIENAFEPADQETYNHATSLSIFDSLGNSHVLTMYFVKESNPNQWTAYVQVDGQNVGEPNPALSPPDNTRPTLAGYNLQFNEDGSLDEAASDPLQVSYWNPANSEGEYNGAVQGLPISQGGVFPNNPPNSSNFEIDIGSVTQFGSDFAVQDISQDGFTTGRLADVDISDDGTIFTRFTNGQARTLGQVALANFANAQGLQPVGSTAWTETADSGDAIIGTPGSSALGTIQSGALEESNVDLSKELVALIIAQRNFQANSKTIQTADAVTQSIINLR